MQGELKVTGSVLGSGVYFTHGNGKSGFQHLFAGKQLHIKSFTEMDNGAVVSMTVFIKVVGFQCLNKIRNIRNEAYVENDEALRWHLGIQLKICKQARYKPGQYPFHEGQVIGLQQTEDNSFFTALRVLFFLKYAENKLEITCRMCYEIDGKN